jgi:hypothetical protein
VLGSASTNVAARGWSLEGLAMRAAAWEGNVKFKAIAVISTTAAFCLGMAGSAGASPLSTKPAPQVTGTRLQSALLPASAFGNGFTVAQRLNSGSKLASTRVLIKPSSLKCAGFETYIFVRGFGNTAGATDSVTNPNPDFSNYPSVILGGDQAVLQFKTDAAATSFYNQAYARYKQCTSFTEPDPVDNSQLELTVQSLVKTTVAKNKAFQVSQLVDLAALPALSFYANTAVVLSGTNVYTIDDVNGTNDPISASLLGKFINRVQALYKHH